MTVPTVDHTGEFQRVYTLPRRVWSTDDLTALTNELTAILRAPAGAMKLRMSNQRHETALVRAARRVEALGPKAAGLLARVIALEAVAKEAAIYRSEYVDHELECDWPVVPRLFAALDKLAALDMKAKP